ncbi:MAG TPA: hypothetical protein VNO32_13895 [Candidatus Acidoferrum sp.]|nr:hypothetical protein [Candidatus Acidoferrum sp.]
MGTFISIRRCSGRRSESRFQQRLEQEVAWVQATKDGVVKGRETYLGILEGDNSGVKIAAAYLLGLIGASDFDTLEENIKSAES